ncbi:RNA-binding protein [Candidatus Bathyarchaeota archaeon]|nr:RNA-binding protein [Candidatus Bathyarchaeota archaeon]
MPATYTRAYVREKEAKTILIQASEKLKLEIEKLIGSKAKIERVNTEFAELFLVNGKPLLARVDKDIFPTLVADEILKSLPKVVIDMGAVPYICNGAHVMAPGIVRFEGELRKGYIASVLDEKHGKLLAVGESLYDKSEAEGVTQGVVVRNLHFVGDKLWKILKETVAAGR